jgi:putative ABC transport system ATP-binding protein
MSHLAGTPVIEALSLSRTFREGDTTVEAVRKVSCTIAAGEFVGLVGPSGCGKSTLLNMFGLAEAPSSGSLAIAGVTVDSEKEQLLQSLRRATLGYVFQAFNLLSTLQVVENVMLPCLLNGAEEAKARERALSLLSDLGLSQRALMYPATLSGGEMQRVAIARAVAHSPKIILADEPTGNLDSVAGEAVLRLLGDIQQTGVAVVMATHSEAAMKHCSRVIRMRDGAFIDG